MAGGDGEVEDRERMKTIGMGLGLLALLGMCANPLWGWNSGESEVHLIARVRGQLTENVGLKVSEEWRARKDSSDGGDFDSYYWQTEVGVPILTYKGIELEPGFRWIRVDTNEGWKTNYLYLLSGTKRFGVGADFSLAVRLRVALNEADSRPTGHHLKDAWEFRPMFTLRYSGWEDLTPYFAYEIYYNLSDGFWYRNRYYLGSAYRLTPRFSLFGDVIKQDDRAYEMNHWEEQWIFRLGLSLKL